MYNQNVELRHLRYFVAVAEELHFSRAAEKLQMAQPPLSQQIRQLERTLGVRLFVRNHHSVVLTAAGQVLLEEARLILEQVEHALSRVQDAHQGLVGRLDVGYIKSVSATDTILPDIRMLLGLVAANLGISIVPASSAAIRNIGVVYRPLADLDDDCAIETAMVWRRKDISPLVQEFLVVAREVLGAAFKYHERSSSSPYLP